MPYGCVLAFGVLLISCEADVVSFMRNLSIREESCYNSSSICFNCSFVTCNDSRVVSMSQYVFDCK
jgi:hypothetical protein